MLMRWPNSGRNRWIAFQVVSVAISFVTASLLWQPGLPWGRQGWMIVPFWIAISPVMLYRPFTSSVAQNTSRSRFRRLRDLLIGTGLVQLFNIAVVFEDIIDWPTATPVLIACGALQVAGLVWFALAYRRSQPA
jgi:hypothetical protein